MPTQRHLSRPLRILALAPMLIAPALPAAAWPRTQPQIPAEPTPPSPLDAAAADHFRELLVALANTLANHQPENPENTRAAANRLLAAIRSDDAFTDWNRFRGSSWARQVPECKDIRITLIMWSVLLDRYQDLDESVVRLVEVTEVLRPLPPEFTEIRRPSVYTTNVLEDREEKFTSLLYSFETSIMLRILAEQTTLDDVIPEGIELITPEQRTLLKEKVENLRKSYQD